jgi:hypothetical protein
MVYVLGAMFKSKRRSEVVLQLFMCYSALIECENAYIHSRAYKHSHMHPYIHTCIHTFTLVNILTLT